ncbi:MAG TPA: hypothetical protein GX392_01640 [Clostridiales bacterium]|nr:hypothetical protein [Clostridiales bacterium]
MLYECFNRGFALVIVVIIVAISIIVGTILMSLVVQNSCMNYDMGCYMTCYYMAYAQLIHTLEIMQTNLEIVFTECNNSFDFIDSYNDLMSSLDIMPLDMEEDVCVNTIKIKLVKKSETSLEYEIEVKASMEGISRRFIAQVIIGYSPENIFEEMFKIISIKEV